MYYRLGESAFLQSKMGKVKNKKSSKKEVEMTMRTEYIVEFDCTFEWLPYWSYSFITESNAKRAIQEELSYRRNNKYKKTAFRIKKRVISEEVLPEIYQ